MTEYFLKIYNYTCRLNLSTAGLSEYRTDDKTKFYMESHGIKLQLYIA